MSIAEKFGKFEIKETDRISKEDQKWLEHREEIYKRTFAACKTVYGIYKSEHDQYSEEELEEFRYSGMLVDDFNVLKKMDTLQNDYVGGIFSHFSNKYHVNLENKNKNSDLERKYYRYSSNKGAVKPLEVEEIDYHAIMDQIFDQLGGMSFEEKAIKEIKDVLKDKCYMQYRDEWLIKVKGKKFTYTGGYCSQSYSGYQFSSTEWMYAMLTALSYNTYGSKVHIQPLNKLYSSYYVSLTEEDFKNGFSAPSVGVENIKFFKNGRVDITFESGEFCRNFAKEWCGYTAC